MPTSVSPHVFLQVVEAGDVASNCLPSIRLLMSDEEEGGEEIFDVNDRLLSDKGLFGVGPA